MVTGWRVRRALGQEGRRRAVRWREEGASKPSEHAQGSAGGTAGSAFPVFSLDDLFSTHFRNETAGLLHLDLEGFEVQALRGGHNVIQRDWPVVVTEVAVHEEPQKTLQLLHTLGVLGYDVWMDGGGDLRDEG